MTSSIMNILKKVGLASFILAVASVSSVLCVLQDERLIDESTVMIPAEELTALYEKLHEQDFDLAEKEKELNELKGEEELPSSKDLFYSSFKKSLYKYKRNLKETKKQKKQKKKNKNQVEEVTGDEVVLEDEPIGDDEVVGDEENTGSTKYRYKKPCNMPDLPNIRDVQQSSYLSPQLEWNFNRGMSTVSTSVPSGAPVVASVMTDATQDAFQIAQLQMTESTYKLIEEKATSIQYVSYQGTNLTNQFTTSAATSIVNLLEYEEDEESGMHIPKQKEMQYFYSLIGIESGEVNLCKVFIGSQVDTVTQCQFKIENLGVAIADILYIPQKNFVVMLTVESVMVGYTVSWNNGEPSLQYFGQLDYLNPCPEGNSEDSDDKKDEACADIPSPRSLSGIYVDDENTFLYLCAPNGLQVFTLQETNSAEPFLQWGDSWIGTNFCVQSLPTPYGLYMHNQRQVLFIPFESYDPETDDAVPSYGMLGSANPNVYLAYENMMPTDSLGVSSDDSGEDTFDLITSIALSLNLNNVVTSRNPVTGVDQSFYKGGAIFIATVRYSDVVASTTKCVDGSFSSDTSDPKYSNSCPGSIELHDICTGQTNPFVNDFIDGPVYGMAVDNNMNVMTQNGQGGVSFFSVGYTPGSAQAGVFLANKENPCASKIKNIISIILGATSLALGFVTGADEVAAAVILAASTVAGVGGMVVPFV